MRPNWEMDLTQQITANVVFGVMTLLCVFYAHGVAKKIGSKIPYYVLVGSALTTPHEVISNILGHCTYPEINQFTAFSIFGRSYPTYLVFDYAFYFGFAINFILLMLHENTLTLKKWMTLFGVSIVFAAVYDPIFVHLGWWGYYGEAQYPQVLGFPMWWWFDNAQIMFVIGAVIHLLRPWISDNRAYLAIPLVPIVCLMAHGTAALPYYAALNSEHPNNTNSLIGTICTAILSFTLVWVFGKLSIREGVARGATSLRAAATEAGR